MGSPDFAVPALRVLHEAGHDIVCVYSQPPRPAGRGQAVKASPVQLAAAAMGLTVRTPARVKRDKAEHAAFAALSLDAAVVAAYGLILPPAMLDTPRLGCLNIHASLLPRWRGAAPIQAAILAGDAESGITIMRMDAGLDTGPMLLREAVPIGDRTTTPELHDRLSALGARLIIRALADVPSPIPQPEDGATYAPKLVKEDGKLDWRGDADMLDRQVRALNPWPGTFALLGAEPIKILAGVRVDGHGEPGRVLGPDFTVACGRGAFRVTRAQRPGRPAMDGAAFLRGVPDGLNLTLQ
jgi:methionyl-tRNA formyltransferase